MKHQVNNPIPQTSALLGSRSERVQARDQLIALRYWWYTERIKLNERYVVEFLSHREFFLHEQYVEHIVQRQAKFIDSLRGSMISASELRERYPSYLWVATASI